MGQRGQAYAFVFRQNQSNFRPSQSHAHLRVELSDRAAQLVSLFSGTGLEADVPIETVSEAACPPEGFHRDLKLHAAWFRVSKVIAVMGLNETGAVKRTVDRQRSHEGFELREVRIRATFDRRTPSTVACRAHAWARGSVYELSDVEGRHKSPAALRRNVVVGSRAPRTFFVGPVSRGLSDPRSRAAGVRRSMGRTVLTVTSRAVHSVGAPSARLRSDPVAPRCSAARVCPAPPPPVPQDDSRRRCFDPQRSAGSRVEQALLGDPSNRHPAVHAERRPGQGLFDAELLARGRVMVRWRSSTIAPIERWD